MQGNDDSSCARRIGQWQAVLAGIAASLLAVTVAQADPRIDGETAAAAIAPQAGSQVEVETAGLEITMATPPDRRGDAETAVTASVAPGALPDAQPDIEMAAAAPAAPGPTTFSCSAANLDQQGVASWYGRHWRGRRTASGRRFDERRLTAASLSLPLATRARVTNLRNGRSVDVLVNDRGPYIGGRIIDLSARAAQLLGMTRTGLAHVAVTALPAPAAADSAI